MNIFEKEVKEILKKATKLKEISLEIPKAEFGDYAFPCFELAKKLKKNPNEIAEDLAKNVKLSKLIRKVEVKGPYLNFFVDKGKLAENVLKEALKDDYGSSKKIKKTVLIESPGPNTNKPLHLGHLRNMSLGISLSNIYSFIGYNVNDVDIINDRGIHICKSILAYKKWGKNAKPIKKSDHFVGDFYVLFAQKVREEPKLEQEAQELLEKWEKKCKETRDLSKKMNKWAVDGMFETYKRFGRKIEKAYYESDTYEEGKKIVLEGLKKGTFEKDDEDNIILDLDKQGLGKKVLVRANGTAVYITQDIATGVARYKDYKMDKMIYVVGNEQIYHFKVLFEIFKILKYPFAKGCYHMAYGMVNLPEGKMKSREGKVVDADDLMDEMIDLAKKEIKKRHKDLSEKEIEKRSEQIGLGAIKFYILKHDPMKDMLYNPEESIKFEGETGPYVQYAHTRICSILDKGKLTKKVDYSLLKEELEQKLITLLSQFPRKITEAANNYKPSIIANYLIELSQNFNSFYVKLPVLKAEKQLKEARLMLIAAVKQVLKTGLNLLGIEAPERM